MRKPEAGDLVVWATLVLVVWECTFTAYDALTLTMPGIGTVSVADLALIGLTSAYVYRVAVRIGGPEWSRSDGLAMILMAWILGAALVNTIDGVLPLVQVPRYTVRLALAWTLFSLVRRLSAVQQRRLLVGLVAVALCVSAVHVYVVAARRTDLIEELYYAYSRSQHRNDYVLLRSALVSELGSAWPGGGLLVSSLAVGSMVGVVTARSPRRVLLWALALVVGLMALLVSLNRSRLLVLWVAVPALLVWWIGIRSRVALRLGALLCIGAVGTGGAFLLAPALQESLLGKFRRLSDTSDASYMMRAYDTHAALEAALRRPLVGNGVSDLIVTDSVFAGDAHGALSFVLVAGVPALLVLLAFCWAVWREGRWRRDGLGLCFQMIFAHMLVLFAFGVEPLVVFSRGLIPFAIVSGLIVGVQDARA